MRTRIGSTYHCRWWLYLPRDVAKGFGGGADFVMFGGMLTGHDEGKGKIVRSNGHKYIEFYGQVHLRQQKHYGGLSDYRSSEEM